MDFFHDLIQFNNKLLYKSLNNNNNNISENNIPNDIIFKMSNKYLIDEYIKSIHQYQKKKKINDYISQINDYL